MYFGDILAIVEAPGESEHVLSFTERLRDQSFGSASALVVGWLPTAPLSMDAWVVNPLWGDLINRAEEDARKVATDVAARFRKHPDRGRVEREVIDIGAARPSIGLRARHADISIVGRPPAAGPGASHPVLEGALFDSGRPVIAVPPNWRPGTVGRSVLVCWKPTREAARAVADAKGFLENAEHVSIVLVDAKPNEGGYGENPGLELTEHFTRRKIVSSLERISSSGEGESQAVLQHAANIGADLIVMGGFGRSRLSEFIFGGLTYDMVRYSPIPLFMSH
ncbi:MAG TPA: universal stress protein [Hyphomonadaceae bacterium]|nr:universal stress protein [Hyphomonadaceae bacterium]